MSFIHRTLRHALIAVAGIVLAATAVLVAAPAAHAVNHDGYVSLKGVGRLYSGNNAIVALAGSSGQTLSFALRVTNPGQTESQFNVKIDNVSGLPATVGLYSGSTLLTIATSSDGYFTAPIPPGRWLDYTLKVKSTLPVGASQRATIVHVALFASDGTQIDDGSTARFEQKAPVKGSDQADITAKNGSQPYVGSHTATQYASSPATYFDGSAKFSVKLAVNAGVSHRLHAYLPSIGDSCFAVKAFAGTVDITSSVASGAYLTKILAPGQSVQLTVQISRIGFQFCSNAQFDIYGYTESGQAVSAVRLLMP